MERRAHWKPTARSSVCPGRHSVIYFWLRVEQVWQRRLSTRSATTKSGRMFRLRMARAGRMASLGLFSLATFCRFFNHMPKTGFEVFERACSTTERLWVAEYKVKQDIQKLSASDERDPEDSSTGSRRHGAACYS